MKSLKIACCLLSVVYCSLVSGIAEGLPAWGSDRASASLRRCREIQRSRRLLNAEGLDDRDLAILEERYCGRIRRRYPRQNSTCSQLKILAGLARMAEGNSSLARMVASEERIFCSGYGAVSSTVWRYANGQVVQMGSQWFYPNGQYARTGQDWRYPNGQYARFGLTWRYPNGTNAKAGQSWYTPTGERLDRDRLVSWGCTYVSREECDRLLLEMRSGNSDSYDAALIELAWQAHRRRR